MYNTPSSHDRVAGPGKSVLRAPPSRVERQMATAALIRIGSERHTLDINSHVDIEIEAGPQEFYVESVGTEDGRWCTYTGPRVPPSERTIEFDESRTLGIKAVALLLPTGECFYDGFNLEGMTAPGGR